MATSPITLLLTNSIDYVADLLVERLGTKQIFRYNSDLWHDYRLCVNESTIEIENPTGRLVTDRDIVKVYRRSTARASTLFPDRPMTPDARFAEEEVWTAWNDIVNIFWAQGKVVLVQPYASMRVGKLQQLRAASRYFRTTPFRFVVGAPRWLRAGVVSVVKSFSFKFEPGVGFYSRRVTESDLDPRYPWFLTDYVEAAADVTVAVVRDAIFAFALERAEFVGDTIDWRLAPSEYAHHAWKPIRAPATLQDAVGRFMRDAGAHYARLDFLETEGDYVFLEANFTGEWAWLDPHGEHGLLAKIADEIDPRTPCVGVPRIGWLAS
jgi:hypothetical protein